MQQVYLNALWLKPPRVFGRQMLPLTLGHAYLLEAIESPCVMDAGLSTRQDCIAAAYLCSHPWRRACRLIPGIAAGRRKWRLVFWGGLNRRADWDRQCSRFMEYVRAYTVVPARNQKTEKRDASPRVPWPLAVAYAAGARSFSDPLWDLPIPEVFAFHAAACAYAGDKSLKSEYELALDARFAEEAANGEG
jgi:hypothetical protein